MLVCLEPVVSYKICRSEDIYLVKHYIYLRLRSNVQHN